MEELPFMATEYIIMEEVKAGGDRQENPQRLSRQHSMEASRKVKMEDAENATVRSGKIIEMEGVTEADLPKIKDLLINKVESREKDLSKLEIPAQAEPKAVPVYNGFISFDAEQLAIFYKEHDCFGLDDLEFIQITLKLNKEINETELKVLDTTGAITVVTQLSKQRLQILNSKMNLKRH
ncbi:hypothetical protein FQR65_LT15791 [Abscondita terminalis]|nr:hypothetical protein FQR65_LT15791 [Abscondita terminalis]